jgi:hypothetical protein
LSITLLTDIGVEQQFDRVDEDAVAKAIEWLAMRGTRS